MRTGLYIYSQAIPFGTHVRRQHLPVPADLGSLSVTFVMIPAAILVYRDDTGSRWRRSSRRRRGCSRPGRCSARSCVMFAIINVVSIFAYGGWFWAIKASGLATSVACPLAVPEAKVYRPARLLREGRLPRGRTRSGSGPPGRSLPNGQARRRTATTRRRRLCTGQPNGR